MHNIEPHYNWRDAYIASEDERSPFFGRVYSEFTFTNKIYNYFIHPQWDTFGSDTLYMKILYVNYEKEFCIMEFIGEWNDAVSNDIMFLKRDVVDKMTNQGIHKFILICENVLNFHVSDDCYYEEWWDDVKEEGGWITFLNLLDHVKEEMEEGQLQFYTNFGNNYNEVNWRPYKPVFLVDVIEDLMNNQVKQLYY